MIKQSGINYGSIKLVQQQLYIYFVHNTILFYGHVINNKLADN